MPSGTPSTYTLNPSRCMFKFEGVSVGGVHFRSTQESECRVSTTSLAQGSTVASRPPGTSTNRSIDQSERKKERRKKTWPLHKERKVPVESLTHQWLSFVGSKMVSHSQLVEVPTQCATDSAAWKHIIQKHYNSLHTHSHKHTHTQPISMVCIMSQIL